MKIFTPINKTNFLNILWYCLTSEYCSYNGQIYVQIEGVVIRVASYDSPMVADIVLHELFAFLHYEFPNFKFFQN